MHRPFASLPGSTDRAARSIALLLQSAIDGEAFSLWCQRRIEGCAVTWGTDVEIVIDACRRLRPRLLVVDPAIGGSVIDRGLSLVREGVVSHLLILDARPMEVRLTAILGEPAASYFSRMASAPLLAAAMTEMIVAGIRAFDPALAPRIRRSDRGFQLVDATEHRSISILSQREQQVMRLLAEGRTVKQCAETLGLSESTIDNHKSRLMKKLGIHKSSELAVRAIRDGLLIV